MCWQDDHPIIIHTDAHGHDTVGRMRIGQLTRLSQLLLVIARRFITMMTVRDKHRFIAHACLQLANRLEIIHHPQAMHNPEVVRGFQWSLTEDRSFQNRLCLICFVRIDSKDLTKVSTRGIEQLQPIDFRCRVRFLMRINIPFTKFFQLHATHKSLPDKRRTCIGKLLMVHVDGCMRFSRKHSFALPLFQVTRCALILLVSGFISGFIPIKDQANHIGRMVFVKLILKFRINDIVRRCNHVAK